MNQWMSGRRRYQGARRALLCLGFGLAAPSVGLGETQLGFGLSRFSLDAGHPSIGQVSVPGYQVTLQYRDLDDAPGLALVAGGTREFDVAAVDTEFDPFYPPDRAEYGFIDLSLRYHFGDVEPGRVDGFLSLGWGLHAVVWRTYGFDQVGAGPSLGGGLQMPLGDHWMLQATLHYSRFDAGRFFGISSDDPDYANTSWRIGLDMIHRFRWLP